MTNLEQENFDTKNHILGASYMENYKFLKELYQNKSEKANKQLIETNKIQKEYLNHNKSKL